MFLPNPRSLVAVSSLLAVCACGGGGANTAAAPLVDSQNNVCSTLSAPSGLAETKYHIDLVLAGDSVGCLSDPARVRATVYAFDAFIADLPATEILALDVPALASGEAYQLRFEKKAFEKIEFQSGSLDALRYYYSINVDINGDGKICSGDLRQDFERTEFASYPATLERLPDTVYMTLIDNLTCAEQTKGSLLPTQSITDVLS